jgi:serine/threonine protein kinase
MSGVGPKISPESGDVTPVTPKGGASSQKSAKLGPVSTSARSTSESPRGAVSTKSPSPIPTGLLGKAKEASLKLTTPKRQLIVEPVNPYQVKQHKLAQLTQAIASGNLTEVIKLTEGQRKEDNPDAEEIFEYTDAHVQALLKAPVDKRKEILERLFTCNFDDAFGRLCRNLFANPNPSNLKILFSLQKTHPQHSLKSPFARACDLGNLKIVEAFLKKDSSCLTSRDALGNTVLHDIVGNSPFSKVTELLLKYSTSMDLLVKNDEEKTSIALALLKNDPNTKKLVFKRFIDICKKEVNPGFIFDFLKHKISPEEAKDVLEGFKKAIHEAHKPLPKPLLFLDKFMQTFNVIEEGSTLGKMRRAILEVLFDPLLQKNPVDLVEFRRQVLSRELLPSDVEVLVQKLKEVPKDNAAYPTVQKIISSYKEVSEIEAVKSVKPTAVEALCTACLLELVVPKIKASYEDVDKYFDVRGGWRILRGETHLYVISPDVRERGTMKELSMALQVPLKESGKNRVVVHLEAEGGIKELEDEKAILSLLKNEAQLIKDITKEAPHIARFKSARVISESSSTSRMKVGIIALPCDGDALGRIRDLQGDELHETELLQRLTIFRDILGAVAFLHSLGIAHLDIKPGNCLLLNGRGFLWDFGTSARMRPKQIPKVPPAVQEGSHCTPEYTPPCLARREIIPDATEETRQKLFAVDVGSLGVLLNVLCENTEKPSRKLDDVEIGNRIEELTAKGETLSSAEKIKLEMYKLMQPLLKREIGEIPTANDTLAKVDEALKALTSI